MANCVFVLVSFSSLSFGALALPSFEQPCLLVLRELVLLVGFGFPGCLFLVRGSFALVEERFLRGRTALFFIPGDRGFLVLSLLRSFGSLSVDKVDLDASLRGILLRNFLVFDVLFPDIFLRNPFDRVDDRLDERVILRLPLGSPGLLAFFFLLGDRAEKLVSVLPDFLFEALFPNPFLRGSLDDIDDLLEAFVIFRRPFINAILDVFFPLADRFRMLILLRFLGLVEFDLLVTVDTLEDFIVFEALFPDTSSREDTDCVDDLPGVFVIVRRPFCGAVFKVVFCVDALAGRAVLPRL